MGHLYRGPFRTAPLRPRLLPGQDRCEASSRRAEMLLNETRTSLGRQRGRVTFERQREIARKIVQGLAIAGL